MRRVFFATLFILMAASCRKEADIRREYQPAATAVRGAQLGMLQFAMPLSAAIGEVRWLDASGLTADSMPDGLSYDFGDGIVLPDGILRKGKALLSYHKDISSTGDSVLWIARPEDSFAIHTGEGWVYMHGYLKCERTGNYMFRAEGYLYLRDGARRDLCDLNAMLELEPSAFAPPSAAALQVWNGSVLNAQGELKLSGACRPGGCGPFFAWGTAAWRGESGLEYDVRFDAYGNKACDEVIRVIYRRDEMLFDTW